MIKKKKIVEFSVVLIILSRDQAINDDDAVVC